MRAEGEEAGSNGNQEGRMGAGYQGKQNWKERQEEANHELKEWRSPD